MRIKAVGFAFLFAFITAGCENQQSSGFQPLTHVEIDGSKFQINGHLTYLNLDPKVRGRLMNVRMVNSTFDDENLETRPSDFDADQNTTSFISSMDQYKSKGILAFTLNLQGGMPGYEGAINSAFKSDGSLKQDYMERVSRVIEAADARGMVIFLGLFYQRQDQVLQDRKAVERATINAATWLHEKGYTNVLIEIANEYKHPGFNHQIILSEEGEVELMNLVRTAAPGFFVSTSGMGDAFFHEKLVEAADYILLHGNVSEPQDYQARIAAVIPSGKPVLFNEDWCYSDDTRQIPDAIEKLKAAFNNEASWGNMNQQRNQTYPFIFTIGKPAEGVNAKEDFELYEAMAELLGIGGKESAR